jgi:hypothetical protein
MPGVRIQTVGPKRRARSISFPAQPFRNPQSAALRDSAFPHNEKPSAAGLENPFRTSVTLTTHVKEPPRLLRHPLL